ncbi:MAG: pantetheine-phosphate adenylyltransferase [Muribaculaceae bacterium]|nr:pantetheine-phosphate adenylyltransferase [Muribaculaceae bacterium]
MNINSTSTRRVLFPGSFNPFTRGHQSLVERALTMFDHVVIAIGVSADKHTNDDITSRIQPIADLYIDEPRVSVIAYYGLTIDAATANNCCAILRGVRNAIDFEYERQLADVNRSISGIETILLMTLPEYSMISSSVVRELERYGRDVKPYLPQK